MAQDDSQTRKSWTLNSSGIYALGILIVSAFIAWRGAAAPAAVQFDAKRDADFVARCFGAYMVLKSGLVLEPVIQRDGDIRWVRSSLGKLRPFQLQASQLMGALAFEDRAIQSHLREQEYLESEAGHLIYRPVLDRLISESHQCDRKVDVWDAALPQPLR